MGHEKQDFVVIGRDPFGRQNFIRRTEWSAKGCAWCGQRRPSGKLFFYGLWSDGGRVSFDTTGFDSRACHDAYYGR